MVCATREALEAIESGRVESSERDLVAGARSLPTRSPFEGDAPAESGVNLLYIRNILGHASIVTNRCLRQS
jgi:hypothetical protein